VRERRRRAAGPPGFPGLSQAIRQPALVARPCAHETLQRRVGTLQRPSPLGLRALQAATRPTPAIPGLSGNSVRPAHLADIGEGSAACQIRIRCSSEKRFPCLTPPGEMRYTSPINWTHYKGASHRPCWLSSRRPSRQLSSRSLCVVERLRTTWRLSTQKPQTHRTPVLLPQRRRGF